MTDHITIYQRPHRLIFGIALARHCMGKEALYVASLSWLFLLKIARFATEITVLGFTLERFIFRLTGGATEI